MNADVRAAFFGLVWLPVGCGPTGPTTNPPAAPVAMAAPTPVALPSKPRPREQYRPPNVLQEWKTAPDAAQLKVVREAVEKLGGRYSTTNSVTYSDFPTLELEKTATDDTLRKLPDVPFPFALTLNGSKVTDEGLKELKRFDSLVALGLRDTKVTDAGVKVLGGLKSLRALNVKDTGVKGDGLAELPSLVALSLGGLPVRDENLKSLESLTRLVKLDLTGLAVTDVGVRSVLRLTKLRSLQLDYCRFDERCAAGFTQLGELAELYINFNRDFNDACLKELAGLKSLVVLMIRAENVTDEGVKHLRPLTGLKALRLTGKVTDASVEVLGSLSNLAELLLFDTKITKAGVDALRCALPGCYVGSDRAD